MDTKTQKHPIQTLETGDSRRLTVSQHPCPITSLGSNGNLIFDIYHIASLPPKKITLK